VPVKYLPFRFSLSEIFHIVFTDGSGSASPNSETADIIVFDEGGNQEVLAGADIKIIDTIFDPNDLNLIHKVQVNDFVYMTCGGDYPVQLLQRFYDKDQDANRWKISEWEHIGGPFNDQNTEDSHALNLSIDTYDSSETYSKGDLIISYGGNSISGTPDWLWDRWEAIGNNLYRLFYSFTMIGLSSGHGLKIGDIVRLSGVVGVGGASTMPQGDYGGVYSIISAGSTSVRLSLNGYYDDSALNNSKVPTLVNDSPALRKAENSDKFFLSLVDNNLNNTLPVSGETAYWREIFYSFGNFKLLSTSNLFKSSDVGRELKIRNTYDERYPTKDRWSSNAMSKAYAMQGTIRLKTEGGSWTGTLLLEESTNAGSSWQTIGKIESRDGSTNASIERELIGVRSLVRVRLIGYASVSGAAVQACIWFLDAINPYYNFFRITDYIDTNAVRAQAISPIVPADIRSDYRWSLGAFGERPGYPRTLSIHEERLVYGGTKEKPNTVWASRVNDWRNFLEGDLDVSPYTFTVKADSFDAIRWIRSARQLMVGTEASESTISAPDESRPISPTNVEVRTHTYYGSGPLQALVTADLVFFVQGQRRRVRSTQYDFGTDQYLSSEMSILASHITAPGIKEMSFHRAPWSMIFFVLINGRAVTFTYERDNRVQGWATMELGGGGIIVSGASNYSTTGDITGLIVQRDSGYYLEETRKGTIYLDAQTVTEGVDYSEGAELPLAYGADAVVVHAGRVLDAEEYTLSGTTLTIPGATGGTVAVGYPYDFIVEPTDIVELGDFGAVKRSTKLGLYLLESGGCQVEINGKVSPFQAWAQADAGQLLDGEFQIPVGGGYSPGLSMRFTGNHIYPFRLAAVGIFGAPSQ
jgi:hypothetical protein